MDLSKLLDGAGHMTTAFKEHGSSSSESLQDNDNTDVLKEGQWRDRMYKRRNMNFDTTSREKRTLKSIQVSERRKSSRQSHQFASRKIDEAPAIEEQEENEENEPGSSKHENRVKLGKDQKVGNTKDSKSKTRKEKLAEYLEQKKKLEKEKKKNSKPAFKVGVVHHPMAPIGAGFHKPNVFSTILNASKSAVPSPRVVSKVKPKITTASVTGRVTRSKAAGIKRVPGKVHSQNREEISKAITPSSNDVKTKHIKKQQKRPSFAPENFEFQLKFPMNPVIEETHEPVFDEIADRSAPYPPSLSKNNYSQVPVCNDEPSPQTQCDLVPAIEVKISEHAESDTRGRRRSRRISGVQPDTTLTKEELCLTPAKRAKDRSASRDRRKSAHCNLCPGEHTCATPRATPRVSRISTLPALSEVDSVSYITEDTEVEGTVDENMKSGKEAVLSETVKDLNNEELAPRRVRRSMRNSSKDLCISAANDVGSFPNTEANHDRVSFRTPDKLSNLARMAVDIPLPTTEKKGSSRRSLKVEVMEVDTAAKDSASSESVETPISTLSKTMDNACLDSTKKETTFKTPLKSARKAVCQSVSKDLDSPISWISTSRGSSKRKRKESPFSYSVPDMFENLEGSPLLAKLENKVLSNENITEEDFDDQEVEQVPASKQIKLDKDFDAIANESEKSVENQNEGVMYFRSLLATENTRLSKVCNEWEKKLEDNISEISDDIQGEIRSVIGQGRLVMAERFGQFSGLVDNCEFKRGEKETTCTDLMGFWEMIYFQVEDVDKKFAKLSEVQANNWKEIMKKPPVSRKKPVVKKTVVSSGPKKVANSGLKALIAAKRKAAEEAKTSESVVEKLNTDDWKEADVEGIKNSEEEKSVGSRRLNIKDMIAKKRAQLAKEKAEKEGPSKVPGDIVTITSEPISTSEITFEGGFFSITSPLREASNKSVTPTKDYSSSPSVNHRRSVGDKLRKSVLKETARRTSGLVSPFVSQVARRSLQGISATEPTILFKDLENTGTEVIVGNAKTTNDETAPLLELFDPIAPLSSPVTKTYGKSGRSPAAKQRQIDAFDEMVCSPTGTKLDKLKPSIPSVKVTEDVELISFDSPAQSGTTDPINDNNEEPSAPGPPKSKVHVKTPSRRSMRVAHTPK